MSNSPIDNENTIYQVYFEVADPAHCLSTLEQAGLISATHEGVRPERFGFYLSIANPNIPVILKTLIDANHLVYQVKRQPIAADIGYMI